MNYTDFHTIIINGHQLSLSEITDYYKETRNETVRQLGLFMCNWLDEHPTIEVQTSGSTGKPKRIKVEKNKMLQSAAMTAKYFDFQERQKALLCLPLTYIAGKMMVVRALYSKLNLICMEPKSNPLTALSRNSRIDFAPLIPMQLNKIKPPVKVKKILLGGAPLNPKLEKKLQSLSSEIYMGYGMTETLSHIAIRRVNGKKKSNIYQALSGVKLYIDERRCLKIETPFLEHPVQTNDIIDLINEREFIWKGRADNVVNSGGIKLFPEEIEKKMYSLVKERFFVAGLPDDKLGEKLCLFVEGREYPLRKLRKLKEDFRQLDKYEKPKEIFFIDAFITTTSGKINRKESMDKVKL